ncbi:hypothetical protein C3L33_05062, partial [Rhododendron williamsianum]
MSRMDTLKRHVPFSGQEGLQELKKIAVRFEEKICTSATSQIPGSLGNQGQLLPIPMAANQAQARQQLLSQNIQNNMAATAVQGSANLASALPTIGGLPPSMPNVVGQNSSFQDIQNSLGFLRTQSETQWGKGRLPIFFPISKADAR